MQPSRSHMHAARLGVVAGAVALLWASVLALPAGITDTAVHLPPTTGAFAYSTFMPASAGSTFVDPVFGTTITRVTGDGADDDLYGRNMCWNADGTKYFHRGKIIDTTTGAVTHTVPTGSSNSDAGFDPVDPNVYYYYSGATIHKVTLGAAGSKTDVVWLTVPATIDNIGGSENWLDASGRILVVQYGAEPAVHLFDTQNLAAGPFGAVPSGSSTAYAMVVPSGRYLVTPTPGSGGLANFKSYPVDVANRTVGSTGTTFWTLCGDHAGFLSPSDGRDYMIAFDCHNTYSIYRIDVSNNVAGLTDAQQHAAPNNLLLFSNFSTTMSTHWSTVARGPNRDWAFMSTEGPTSLTGWLAYQNEIVAINVLTGERRRLAHHRSNITADYFTQPRVSASWGGEVVGWSSNFQQTTKAIYTVAFGGAGGGSGDTTPPTVSMTAPAGGATLTGTATVSATAADNVGVAGVQFRANGTNIGSEVTSAPYSMSWNSTSVADGAYNLTAMARDAAGNTTTSAAVAVTVANSPPVVSAVSASGVTLTAATILWTTNVPADSQVDYGTTTAYGSSSTLVSTLVTSHSQALSGLTPNATYHYRVRSANINAQLTVSGDFTFIASTPPVISGVAASAITGTTATIGWTTDQSSDSQVDYGLTTSYGTSTTLNASLVTTHSQALSGLATGTTYHYRVKSRNAASLLATSADATFATPAAPTISGVAASSLTGTAATIGWTTNQASDTQVDYGTTTAYGTTTTLNTALVTAHTQALSGLSAGTAYHYRVKSRNAQSLLATSGDFTFTTVAPPVISAVAAGNLTGTSATITWTTNQTADSQIDYGPTSAYGTTTTLDSLLVTSHGRTLTGLSATTAYHYRVKSRNSVGLLATSGDFTFTTTSGGGTSFSLAVTLTGPGSGAVIAPIAGISCGSTCSGSVASGTAVTLTAIPAAGSAFDGWSGACAGSSLTCTLTIAAVTTVTARFEPSTTGDFDGDGFADLVWQHTDGTLALWTMHGTAKASATFITPRLVAGGASWQIIDPNGGSTGGEDPGTGGGTLPGFQHVTPAGLLSAVYLTPQSRIVDRDWHIVATPDLDGDGKADLLWQHAVTGKLAAWLMDGAVKTSASFLTPDSVDPSSTWQIQGTGDFNGDGKADIIFQQLSTGLLSLWYMNGTMKIGEQALTPASVPVEWRMVGAGDFDSDGQTDLVWQNSTTGDVYVWLMNGTSMRVEQPIGRFGGPEWQVVAVGDFDGDGHADLIWEKTTGELAAWLMDGIALKSSASLTPGSVDPAWRIMGVK